MRKTDNFQNCLEILKNADFLRAGEDDIYRTGIIGQFGLTFELAWKALQGMLREYSVMEAETGSPREILKAGYGAGWISDPEVWLLMLKKSNLSVHVYDEEEIDETIVLIRDSFLPAFDVFLDVLEKAEKEEQDEGWT